jgi:hypothetical protein
MSFLKDLKTQNYSAKETCSDYEIKKHIYERMTSLAGNIYLLPNEWIIFFNLWAEVAQ